MNVYDWYSNGFGVPGSEVSYSVSKYSKIRKSVALCRHGPNATEVVAYFTSTENALRFCEEMSLRIHEPEDVIA